MPEHDLFQVTVKAIVLDKLGKVLFIRDNNGIWDLPGGRIHHSEDFISGLKRECLEELGVDCQIIDKMPRYVWTDSDNLGNWRIMIIL